LTPCGPWPVQLNWILGLTSEEYVSQQTWCSARLDRCPLHPRGGCGFHRLGTYGRAEPVGARVPRWYCPTGKQTFSLLADCFAARLPGSLRDIELVVGEVERLGAVETAAHIVRGHDVELPGAVRWTRRRLNAVRMTLVTLIGLMPERFLRCEPTLASFRQALGVELVLPALRNIAADHLAALPPPLGFAPRRRCASRRKTRPQHFTGPDPPRRTR
jgi:hypothetical protein